MKISTTIKTTQPITEDYTISAWSTLSGDYITSEEGHSDYDLYYHPNPEKGVKITCKHTGYLSDTELIPSHVEDIEISKVVGHEELVRNRANLDGWSKKAGKTSYSKKFGGLLVIAEVGHIHNLPIKGKLIQSKNGQYLFFADEENGTDELYEIISRNKNRFVSDEAIYAGKIKNGAKYCSVGRNNIFVVE